MRGLFWQSWALRDFGEASYWAGKGFTPWPEQCFLDRCPPYGSSSLGSPVSLMILAQGCTLTPTVALGGSGTLAPLT